MTHANGADRIPLAIGVTSHRNIPAAQIGAIRERVREFFARLARDYPDLPLTVASALAQGGDQLVAEEALAIGARLIAVLPMERAQYAEDFLDAAEHARFDALCARAEVIELPRVAGNSLDDANAAPTGLARDRHYAQAGVYISSHCHILLAIWDGKSSDRLGGTAQTVEYHLFGTRPASAERRRTRSGHAPLNTDIERLAYHIVSSREGHGGAPALPLQPFDTFWRVGDRATPGSEPMPDVFRASFAHMTEFNADWAKYRAEIDAKAAL